MPASVSANEAYVETHHDELLQRAREAGLPVVLVHDREAISFHKTEIEAMKAGYAQFGRDPFLVRPLDEDPRLRVVASNFLPC